MNISTFTVTNCMEFRAHKSIINIPIDENLTIEERQTYSMFLHILNESTPPQNPTPEQLNEINGFLNILNKGKSLSFNDFQSESLNKLMEILTELDRITPLNAIEIYNNIDWENVKTGRAPFKGHFSLTLPAQLHKDNIPNISYLYNQHLSIKDNLFQTFSLYSLMLNNNISYSTLTTLIHNIQDRIT